jgi:hypothetical protein
MGRCLSFKVPCDLGNDPRVIRLCARTGLDEYQAVGRLMKLWSWGERHLRATDGSGDGVTLDWIDHYLDHDGIGSALLESHLLELDLEPGREGLRLLFWEERYPKRRPRVKVEVTTPISTPIPVVAPYKIPDPTPAETQAHVAQPSFVAVRGPVIESVPEPVVIPPVEPSKPKPAAREKGEKDDTLWDAFWAAYPKKVAKVEAKRAWDRLKVNADLSAKIMQSLDGHKKSHNWTKEEGQFIPHPATWLNARRWEDELKVETPKGQSCEDAMARAREFLAIANRASKKPQPSLFPGVNGSSSTPPCSG